MQALKIFEKVPLSHLSKAYSTTIYNNTQQVMNFEVYRHKTSISKEKFCKLLTLSSSSYVLHPDSIAISHLIAMFHQMGYNSDLSLLSKFKKSALPPLWNVLFTIFFKCLSERVSGSDSASKILNILIYGLIFGENIDYGIIMCTRFALSVSSNTKYSQISCARFWSIVVRRALNHWKVREMKDVLGFQISKMQTTTFVTSDPKSFNLFGSIPEVILARVPLDNDIINAYRGILNYVIREILVSLRAALAIVDIQKRGRKRKTKSSQFCLKETKATRKPKV